MKKSKKRHSLARDPKRAPVSSKSNRELASQTRKIQRTHYAAKYRSR